MADNVAYTPGSGATIAADDVGAGVLHQRVKVTWGVDGTGTDASATNPLPVADYPWLIDVTASAMTRPANTTAYAANDAVSNNATAGSVTAISISAADVNDKPANGYVIRIDSTDTGVQGKSFRVWLFKGDPTASSGIVGGDNAAFSVKKTAGLFVRTFVGTFKTFSDGAVAICSCEDGAFFTSKPSSGAATYFALLQTIDAFTPSANSTTFTLTFEGAQGRA